MVVGVLTYIIRISAMLFQGFGVLLFTQTTEHDHHELKNLHLGDTIGHAQYKDYIVLSKH